jgi:hypothetical protein
MYKRFSLEEIKSIQNTFVQNLYNNMKKERCISLIDFFKKIFRDGTDTYYCNRNEVTFSCSKAEDKIILRDEREKIEVILDENSKKDLHNIIKNFIIKKEKQF